MFDLHPTVASETVGKYPWLRQSKALDPTHYRSPLLNDTTSDTEPSTSATAPKEGKLWTAFLAIVTYTSLFGRSSTQWLGPLGSYLRAQLPHGPSQTAQHSAEHPGTSKRDCLEASIFDVDHFDCPPGQALRSRLCEPPPSLTLLSNATCRRFAVSGVKFALPFREKNIAGRVIPPHESATPRINRFKTRPLYKLAWNSDRSEPLVATQALHAQTLDSMFACFIAKYELHMDECRSARRHWKTIRALLRSTHLEQHYLRGYLNRAQYDYILSKIRSSSRVELGVEIWRDCFIQIYPEFAIVRNQLNPFVDSPLLPSAEDPREARSRFARMQVLETENRLPSEATDTIGLSLSSTPNHSLPLAESTSPEAIINDVMHHAQRHSNLLSLNPIPEHVADIPARQQDALSDMPWRTEIGPLGLEPDSAASYQSLPQSSPTPSFPDWDDYGQFSAGPSNYATSIKHGYYQDPLPAQDPSMYWQSADHVGGLVSSSMGADLVAVAPFNDSPPFVPEAALLPRTPQRRIGPCRQMSGLSSSQPTPSLVTSVDSSLSAFSHEVDGSATPTPNPPQGWTREFVPVTDDEFDLSNESLSESSFNRELDEDIERQNSGPDGTPLQLHQQQVNTAEAWQSDIPYQFVSMSQIEKGKQREHDIGEGTQWPVQPARKIPEPLSRFATQAWTTAGSPRAEMTLTTDEDDETE